MAAVTEQQLEEIELQEGQSCKGYKIYVYFPFYSSINLSVYHERMVVFVTSKRQALERLAEFFHKCASLNKRSFESVMTKHIRQRVEGWNGEVPIQFNSPCVQYNHKARIENTPCRVKLAKKLVKDDGN